jgi:DNA-binding SARP family transcriptional activator
MPELAPSVQLEVVAQAATGLLAAWLGLTVAVRARHVPAARAFGLLTLFLVSWSVAIIVQRLSEVPGVLRVANAFEEVGAFGVIAATPHIAVALTAEGRWTFWQRATVIGAYAVAALMGLPAVVNPAAKWAITPPHFELPGIPGEVFGWAWIVARIALFAIALAWIVVALRAASTDQARQRQLHVALLTVALGAAGGIARFTPPLSDSDPWIGVSLVMLAIMAAAYAVFAQRIFFPADVAAKTFRYSVVAGLAVTAWVAVLVGGDRLFRNLVGIELPLVTALGVVATVALLEPAGDQLRRRLTGRTRRDAAYERLLRALGESIFTAQRPADAIEPALAQLCRIFAISGASVSDRDGEPIAAHGSFAESSTLGMHLPLESEGEMVGQVVFGPKRSQLPYASDETELLRLAASYLAGSIRLAAREQEQLVALDELSVERARVATAGADLHAALVTEDVRAPAGLRVFALGPLRVERDGQLVRQWGGAKAGTRQAEAVFAFLLDRGERGVSKEEMVELIWPDVDLERADLAFHRTLGGLRTTLEPGRRGGDRGTAVTYHNDRYRLDPVLLGWSDVAAFEEEIATAGRETDPDEALQRLEHARSLYRGDYLDDCPFYGDSAQVEERRDLLRGRYVDLLVALGQRYEARGDRPAAAACFREARTVAGDDVPPADEGLSRLGASV